METKLDKLKETPVFETPVFIALRKSDTSRFKYIINQHKLNPRDCKPYILGEGKEQESCKGFRGKYKIYLEVLNGGNPPNYCLEIEL